MPASPPTLLTVARLAGVSRSTASRALRGHPLLAPETIARVRAAAEKLSYSANPFISDMMRRVRGRGHARHLGTIAYLTFHDTAAAWRTNATYTAFYDGAKRRADDLGFSLELIWAREPGLHARRLTQILKTRGITGVIVGPRPVQPTADVFDWSHFSVATVGVPLPQRRLHQAGSHHGLSMERLLVALAERGYQRPGLALTPPQLSSTDPGWLTTWSFHQQALAEARRIPLLELDPINEKSFARWFKRHRPDVVIGLHEELLPWLARLDVRVPEDVGFARLSRHGGADEVAGIDQHPAHIGAAAVDLVVNQIFSRERGVPSVPRCLLIEGEWVDGWSVRARKTTASR